jgi:hypothetical protein
MTDQLARLAATVAAVYQDIHERVFLDDPIANARLGVEVVEPAMAEDTPTLVLITPWTINGMAFPPDEEFPDSLRIGEKSWVVFRHELDELGVYRSLNLVSHVGCLDTQDQARELACAMAPRFTQAVARLRRDVLVPDPSRRKLLGLTARS